MCKIARIASAMLEREDSDIMTFMIYIDECTTDVNARFFRVGSINAISEILDVVGVTKWEDLIGKYIRFEDNDFGTKIGHITDDKWMLFPRF